MSLDVAEAKADALRLTRSEVDLDELLRIMVDLYEPSMSEKGIRISLQSSGPLRIEADAALIHRMIANLFDNELKHLPAACTVALRLKAEGDNASITLEDDGPGFDLEVLPQLFERRIRGKIRLGTVWALPLSMRLRAPTAELLPHPIARRVERAWQLLCLCLLSRPARRLRAEE